MSETQTTEGQATAFDTTWRAQLAGNAGAEIGAIAVLLQRDSDGIDPGLLRGVAIRLEHLASVVLSAAWDDRAVEADVSELLHGPEAARMRAQAAQA